MMMNPFPFGFPPVRGPYPKYNPPPSNNNIKNNLDSSLLSNNNFPKTDEEYFEIFGLKLHFDDLLIISLLFFLYQEDVKDTYLYIALILLLLS